MDHILEFGDKINLDSLQKGLVLYTGLDCKEQQSGRLAATLRANCTVKLTLKISRNRRKKSREITAKSANFTAKLTLKIPRNLSFFSREIPEGLSLLGTCMA